MVTGEEGSAREGNERKNPAKENGTPPTKTTNAPCDTHYSIVSIVLFTLLYAHVYTLQTKIHPPLTTSTITTSTTTPPPSTTSTPPPLRRSTISQEACTHHTSDRTSGSASLTREGRTSSVTTDHCSPSATQRESSRHAISTRTWTTPK